MSNEDLLCNPRMLPVSNYSFQFIVLPQASVFHKSINHGSLPLFNASLSFVLFDEIICTPHHAGQQFQAPHKKL